MSNVKEVTTSFSQTCCNMQQFTPCSNYYITLCVCVCFCLFFFFFLRWEGITEFSRIYALAQLSLLGISLLHSSLQRCAPEVVTGVEHEKVHTREN